VDPLSVPGLFLWPFRTSGSGSNFTGMDGFSRSTYVFVLVFGSVVVVPFLLSTIYRTLKKGIIDRKPPRQPFTRQGTPKAFWATVSFMAIGPVMIVWGMGVMLYRLLYS
jgi:hypothetical protein